MGVKQTEVRKLVVPVASAKFEQNCSHNLALYLKPPLPLWQGPYTSVSSLTKGFSRLLKMRTLVDSLLPTV